MEVDEFQTINMSIKEEQEWLPETDDQEFVMQELEPLKPIKDAKKQKVRWCSLKHCQSRRDDGIKIFRFPAVNSLTGQIWRKKCNIAKEMYGKNLFICERHFKACDVGKRCLKKDALPEFFVSSANRIDDDVPSTPELTCAGCLKKAKTIKYYRKKCAELTKKCNKFLAKTKRPKAQRIPTSKGATDALKNIDDNSKTYCKLLITSRPKDSSSSEQVLVQSIWLASQRTYSCLRNHLHLNLPRLALMKRCAPVKQLQPGFINNGFEALKQKIAGLQQRDRDNIVLRMNGMVIRPELRYNEALDIIDGFESLGYFRTETLGRHVCVFTISGLFSNWCFVLNYFVAENGIEADCLSNILTENLGILHSLGLTVKVITCDQRCANRKTFSLFEVSAEKPYFEFNSKKIYCMFDFPHLLKSLRNQLMKSDLQTADGMVSFKVLEELWTRVDGATSNMCTKLTKQHILPSDAEKTRLKYVAELFSKTVATSIRTVAETVGFKAQSKEVALSTAAFIEKVDKIFDCLNSSSLHPANPYRCPIQKHNQTHEFSKFFLSYIKQVSSVDPQSKVCCLARIQQTLNALLQLVEDMLPEHSLSTKQLHQRTLEQCFSAMRPQTGNKALPTVAEVNDVLAKLMASRIMHHGEAVEHRTSEYASEAQATQNIPLEDLILHEHFSFDSKSHTELAAMRYFVGYIGFKLLPKLLCATCSGLMMNDAELLTGSSELFVFHKHYSNASSDFGSLNAPSQTFFEVSRAHIGVFDKIFAEQPHSEGIKAIIMEACKATTTAWFDDVCAEHRLRLLDFLILMLLRKQCLWLTPTRKCSSR